MLQNLDNIIPLYICTKTIINLIHFLSIYIQYKSIAKIFLINTKKVARLEAQILQFII